MTHTDAVRTLGTADEWPMRRSDALGYRVCMSTIALAYYTWLITHR